MKLIAKHGHIEIWQVGDEFYVYGILNDPRICPSLAMAYEVAASA